MFLCFSYGFPMVFTVPRLLPCWPRRPGRAPPGRPPRAPSRRRCRRSRGDPDPGGGTPGKEGTPPPQKTGKQPELAIYT